MISKDKIVSGTVVAGVAVVTFGALYLGHKIVKDGELNLGPISMVATPALNFLKEEAGQADFLASLVESIRK